MRMAFRVGNHVPDRGRGAGPTIWPMGPLQDVTIVELGGIGPVPFAGMLLSDAGATVIRVDRVDAVGTGPRTDEPLLRGRRSIAVDLKQPEGVALILRLVAKADALIEGFRPGVAERLGLGPAPCRETNPSLVYGRMTGWGQDGPMAHAAGHDINYVALSGALSMIGPAGAAPAVPLNLVGDFGGGAMLLAFGVVSAILAARASGVGQVVDAAMVEGASLLTTMIHGLRAQGLWTDERSSNLLDGGAPFYGVYETSDGGWVSIGAIEPAFYRELLDRIGLSEDLPAQYDQGTWRQVRTRFEAVFAGRTLAEWRTVLEGTDACFAPVLSLDEAAVHPQAGARGAFIELGGVRQPAPAPRFGPAPPPTPEPPVPVGRHTDVILGDLGLDSAEVDDLRRRRVVG